MTDKEYLKQMTALSDKFQQVTKTRPINFADYDAVLEEIRKTPAAQRRSRRRRSWFAISLIFFLLAVLTAIIGHILW